MEALPEDILQRFMKGEHVMRHKPVQWNGIWSDMFIETTFMRYGLAWPKWNSGTKTIIHTENMGLEHAHMQQDCSRHC